MESTVDKIRRYCCICCRRRLYVLYPYPYYDTGICSRRVVIGMLWTQALLAAIAVIGFVLAAEEVKENPESGKKDLAEIPQPIIHEPEKVGGAQDRADVGPQYKLVAAGPPKNFPGGHDPGQISLNQQPILPPGIKRTHLLPHGPPQQQQQQQPPQRLKDFPLDRVYHTSNQILHNTYEVPPGGPVGQEYPGHVAYQGGQDGPEPYPGPHEEYDGIPSVVQGGEDYNGYKSENHNNLFQGFPSLPHSDPWPLPMPDMPKIINLDVKCEKNLMKVAVEFDKPFHGIIFSKGHYSYGGCVHLPAGSGQKSVFFDISINSCGTHGSSPAGQYGTYGGPNSAGSYFENTIVVQYDPQVQEVWDQARRLRCTWHDQYEKAVTFRPFPVDMLNVVRADFAGDNVGCWMQIQVGKGPWASEVAGIVKIGQTMTMVLAIKDEENKFDMMVRNCIAHDGKRAPIELVDSQGCIVRPKLMSRFTKVKNFGSSASVLAFAHFQAFKFPDSMDVHFQCTIQICRPNCPEQCGASGLGYQIGAGGPDDHYVAGSSNAPVAKPREQRDVSSRIWTETEGNNKTVREMTEIGLKRVIRVVSTGDLAFGETSSLEKTIPVFQTYEKDDLICMSTPGFAASLVVLLSILVISCLVAAFLCLRQKSPRDVIMSLSATVIKKNKH